MPQPIAYLSFDGNCEEAMRFYAQTLKGNIETAIRNADTPWAEQTPPEHLQRFVHIRLALLDNGLLYGGDCPPTIPFERMTGVSLTLNYDTVDEARRVFTALAEGGRITMDMQPAFWAKAWGMLVDRFGISWIVNGEAIPI